MIKINWNSLWVLLGLGLIITLTAGQGSSAAIHAAPHSGPGPKWVAPPAASTKRNPVASNDASIQVGKKIFGKECVSCHGKTGVGNGPKAVDLEKPPGNLTTEDFQSQSDGALFWKITKGNKPMPTFATAYSEQERWSIINYLRTLGK